MLRAVIADDELLLREGVARVLEEAGIEVVARAGDAPDLRRKVRGHKPDVAIIDASADMELFDLVLERETFRAGITTLPIRTSSVA